MCLINMVAIAQQKNIGVNQIPRETVFLSSNSNVFVVGETLYYNFFCLAANKSLSSISKLGYVALLGENGQTLFKHKLLLNKGLGNGDYFISTEIKTGQYKLVAYTKWMKNANPLFLKDIYIINPFLINKNTNKKESVIIQIDTTEIEAPKVNSQNIQVETKFNNVQLRSLVSVDLKNSLGDLYNGNYSISVRKVNPIEIISNAVVNDNVVINKKNNFNLLPEIRGEIVSGLVKFKTNDSLVANINVGLSIPGKNFILKNAKTNSSGRFYFSLYENYNSSDVLVQVLNENNNNYKIVLDDPDFYDYSNLSFSKIHLNKNLYDWLVSQSVYNQIESTYYDSKKDSVIIREPNAPFYMKPDVEYLLDDYKRFSTLRETFVEIIQSCAIRKQNGVYKFKVNDLVEDRVSSYSNLDPLVLFDGVLIENNQDIIDYDAFNIKRIDVVRGTYFYGPSIFYGIVDIKTKNGDFTLPENANDKLYFKLDAPLNSKSFYKPNYKSEKDDLKRIPDYRRQLLWLPSIQIDSGIKTIEFYTSDVEGTFEIVLDGFTNDGKYIVSKKHFKVKK
ncbi:hypothetical protein [Thalassobellus sediminis]|uniref:hypothetical protein n=1 Tax=Thalassobellus sediminis TaxID=3367753 RepID=UPI003F6E2090